MQRAAEIFVFDEKVARTPFLEKVWRTRSEPFESFISVAETHWEMVVTRQAGQAYLTVRGPETKATTAPIPEDAEFFGIVFKLGTFMPSLPLGRLVDGGVTLPEANRDSFWLNGSAWQLPDYGNADVFADRLVRKGLLVRDPIVDAALQGRRQNLSLRSVQRRVLRSTGLTHGTIRQIERAKKAAALLDSGAAILDAVEQAGYADQAHLTRSLKRFIGISPKHLLIAHER